MYSARIGFSLYRGSDNYAGKHRRTSETSDVKLYRFEFLRQAYSTLILPDPLFMQNIQDIRIKQGLIGSESGLILGFLEFWINGGSVHEVL